MEKIKETFQRECGDRSQPPSSGIYLSSNVERKDEKAALWSDFDRYTGRVDAVRTLLLK